MEQIIELSGHPLVAVLVLLVLALLVLVIGVKAFPWLKKKEQGYPGEVEIEALLLPIIYKGICGAYRTSEVAVDEVKLRMDGVDKKKVADSIYAMLPDNIIVPETGIVIPLGIIKAVVSRERFPAR